MSFQFSATWPIDKKKTTRLLTVTNDYEKVNRHMSQKRNGNNADCNINEHLTI